MLLRALPLITGLLPIIGIHASYWLAIQSARVPACLPYITGCTSVSSVGRYPPASFLFKAIMLPEAVLLMVFWLCSAAWLQSLDAKSGIARPFRNIRLAIVGCLGALALIVYVTFLGTHESFYEFMRRFGVYWFFLLTLLAQLDLSLRLRNWVVQNQHHSLLGLSRLLVTLAILPFLLGILNMVLKVVLTEADATENMIEWIALLLMQCHIALIFLAWRDTEFRGRFSVFAS